MATPSLDAQLIQALSGYLVPAALGLTRLLTCFAWLPYLGAGALPSRMVRVGVALVVLVGLWPVTEMGARPADLMGLALATAREALVGTALGLMLALPYHVFHAVGSMLDTQRGAGVGAMMDPLSGVEATEMANLLQMMSAAVFLLAGGLLPLMQALQQSYAVVPIGAEFVPALGSLHTLMDVVLGAALRMAAPVILLLFLVEIMLGVLSRFAQQLNAFSVSLSVKSIIAFAALLVYLMGTVTGQVPALWQQYPALRVFAMGAGG